MATEPKDAPIQDAVDFIHHHREEILEGYFKLLSFPSISADPAYAGDVKKCAEWIVGELKRIGFENAKVIETEGHPVVYADWLHAGDDKPTVLVYDHYDVQPVDPLHLWKSEPFEAEIRDGKLYARGASDNKAGVWGNLKVLESMLSADGKLPLNVKIMFEGEEESGSPSMEPFVAANKELLQADIMLNCDGGFDMHNPQLAYAGRGIISAEVTVKGPRADLHSGGFGGVVRNPLHVAAEIIASLHDEDGRVTLPGYYDRVREIDETERARITAGWEAETEKNKKTAGVDFTWGRSIAPDAERATVLPTLDVNGMWGGYQGPGSKTIIPAEASFKVTMRLVPDQQPPEIAQIFKEYVEGFATDTITIDVLVRQEGWPFLLETDGDYLAAVQAATEATIGKPAQLVRTGGSIPILGMFNRLMDMPITGFGYGDGENIHSPNEYIDVEHFFLALQAGLRMYHNLGAVEK
ncbi:dipeptidase [Phototrophicus methaneseepsis]|uniref:Dipeptidase n=1 Tax=Phototrophicus methaneseepsis TaxID=2710758 RepID=A0A7S8E8R0_9CHLR|nr:dipeptidase [Phototrophicus methaneseepsis]QPC82324.1 dipeptidase [Phototrophicus methaneseepsis]